MVKHMRMVHEQLKPHDCDVQSHVDAVHKKLRPFACTMCETKCARKSHLGVHITIVQIFGPFPSKRQNDHLTLKPSPQRCKFLHYTCANLNTKTAKCFVLVQRVINPSPLTPINSNHRLSAADVDNPKFPLCVLRTLFDPPKLFIKIAFYENAWFDIIINLTPRIH